MPERGQPRDVVLTDLDARLSSDLRYESGEIVGSMISEPHPLAREVFARYLEKNVGDPGLFPGTAAIEREAVAMLGGLLGHPSAAGHIVSGGNEANIVALWVARTRGGDGRTEVVVPASAHVSWDKAAKLLGLDLMRVPLTATHVMDIDAARAAISPKTVALVGAAGCTPLGCVDPIPELSALALEHGLYLHVDAAFGGFVLPFLRDLGRRTPDFDFSLDGVSSITVDAHKMGLAVQPAGGLLFRSEDLPASVEVAIPYLAGGHTTQATLTGTRPGASALAIWALFRHLGRAGYREIVELAMQRTAWLVERVRAAPGVSLVVEPTMNIVGIRPDGIPVAELAARLRKHGWAVAEFPTHIRIVVLPHVSPGALARFVEDLSACARPQVAAHR